MAKVFEATQRVFIFGSRAASGYSSIPVRLLRFLPATGTQSVVEGTISVVINHQLNQSGLGFLFTSNWATTCWVSSQTNDSVTVYFGSQAPSNASVIWEASIMPIQTIADGDLSAVINHNMNDSAIPIFVTANWNTTIFDSTVDRTTNTATVYFGSQASGSGNQIMWRIGI